MKDTAKTGKRIVSKGTYVKAKTKRESLRFMGVCFVLSAGVTGVFAITRLLAGDINAFMFCMFFLVFGKWGVESITRAQTIDPGVPLTRANTADLPAPDSLVRASQEPVQAQEAVLLRGSVGRIQEGAEEQLLRAAAGE